MERTLFEHMPKLVRVKTKESIEHILQSLWRTRKSGLDSAEKAHIQDLLQLPSQEELDPVLVCLRMLIRKCVYENFGEDELQKLFPPEVAPELQGLLLQLLQELQKEWKEDTAKDQPEWPRTRVLYQVKVNPTLPQATPPQISKVPAVWPRLEDSRRRSNRCEIGIPVGMPSGNLNPSRLVPRQPTQDDVPADSPLAMTWSMENQNSTPANRVAVINLKLQDYTKPSSGETEIKFQLSRDTLEAMLRSMYYIRDQLSNVGVASTGPTLKKQRQ